MPLDRWFQEPTERAIGGRKRPFLKHRFILISFFLATLMFLSWSHAASAFSDGKIVIRSDLAPLEMDFEKGRFGSGKLYFDDPIDLAVGEDGDIYILDAGNYRVQVMSDRGRYIDRWGTKGDQDGQFDEPVALAINLDNDFIVVLDQGSNRVHKFELDGTFLLSFGEDGSRKGKLEEPVDITIDALDYVYILDRERKMVLKFHRNGTFIEEWGDKGKPKERLADPVSVVYSDELAGYIYILDAGKMALLKYQRDGDFEEVINLVPDVFDGPVKPVKVEVSDENEVFILDGLHGKLIKLHANEINVLQLTSDELVIDEPIGMAIDEENNIYISDLRKNRILRFQMELD